MVTPGYYRHYKGNKYEVLFIARHSESLEDMVVYRALYGDYGVWVRPLAMFLESVVCEGKSIPRFLRCEKGDKETMIPLLVVFDGVCNLCSGLIQFISRQDNKARFRFVALQTKKGQDILTSYQIALKETNTVLFLNGETCHQKSSAVLNILKNLGGFWSILYICILIPTPIRDWAYSFIASRRYRWFGKKDSCFAPSSDIKHRFLE